MTRLNTTTPQFVRCIKPNATRAAGAFDAPLCLQQLRYSGVFEVTAITKSGFPFRFAHQAFVHRYRCLTPDLDHPTLRASSTASPSPGLDDDEPPPLPGELPPPLPGEEAPPPLPSDAVAADWGGAAAALIAALPDGLSDPSRLHFGKTMVLWRVNEHERLELLRNLAVEARVVRLQAYARRRLARRQRKHAARARAACEAGVAARDATALAAAVDLASRLPISFSWGRKAQQLLAGLAHEARIRETLEQLTGRDADGTYDRLSAALEEGGELGGEFAAAHAALIGRARAQVLAVGQRREARAALKQIIDGDSLRRGLGMAAELGLFDGSDPLSAPLDDDKEALMIAQAALSRIELEEAKLSTLRRAVFEEGVLRWSAAHQPLLADCVTGTLRVALEESIAFGARSKDGVFLQEAGRAVLALREAVLAVGDGDWSAEQREGVEAVVLSCVPLHERVPELLEAAQRVAVRSTVREVVMLLEQSVAVLHHEALKMGLMRAAAIGDGPMAAHLGLLKTATALDVKLDTTREGLRLAVRSVKIEQLRTALASAEAIGLAHYEQPAAASLAAQIARVLAKAESALRQLEPKQMKEALAEAESFSFRADPIETIRKYLTMPAEKFLTEQLKMASRLGQEERQDDLSTQIKMHLFERTGVAVCMRGRAHGRGGRAGQGKQA